MSGLDRFAKIWLGIFSAAILAATIFFSVGGTNWADWKSVGLNWIVAPLSALTGVICVVLCARGHIANYWFGLFNSLTYGLIAWVSGYYGDWLLNWFYFLPTQFFILAFWRKNLEGSTDIVKMRRLTLTQIVYTTLASVAALIGFGYLLNGVDHWFFEVMKRNASIYKSVEAAFGMPLLGPMFDSSTEVLQIVAQILLIKRYAEQWPMWIAVNVITIIMWAGVLVADPSSAAWAVPTMVMWIAFLLNSVYGTYLWYKGSR